MKRTYVFVAIVLGHASICTPTARALDMHFGNMKANKILFLGNSVTLHPPKPAVQWEYNWGMAASSQDMDFVHRLGRSIEQQTGGALLLDPRDPAILDPDDNGDANVVNFSGPMEIRYTAYDSSTLQQQIAAQPDIVILQFGENIDMGSFDGAKLKSSLQSLMAELRDSSDPHIFVTSYILADNDGRIDAVKREVCAEDPSHRVFVDLSNFRHDWTNYAAAEPYYQGNPFILSHPGDKGMKFIADGLFEAMRLHSVPEPNIIILLMLGLPGVIGYARRWRS